MRDHYTAQRRPARRARRGWLAVAGAALLVFVWLVSYHSTSANAPGQAAAIIQLTTDPAIDVRPAWSPDNRMIAFQSDRGGNTFHIYLMNADGSNQHPLTSGPADDRHPVWTHDGKSIVYDSSTGDQREIWMVNVADGSRKQLTHFGMSTNFAAPSPDGQRLAFYVYNNEVLDLWTSRIDGSDAKQVTHQLASAQNNQCTFACHHAAWSADSRMLAYSAGELDNIWTVSSDGGNANQVIANGEDNHFPWFMPDGRLGYITEHVSPIQSWTDAWALDMQSGQATLMQGQMSVQGPFEWSNDGQKVLFHSPRAGNFDIYMIDLSAPGGREALQGTPVPVGQGSNVAIPVAPTSAPAVNAPAAVDSGLPAWTWLAALAALVVVALALFAFSRERGDWD